jgi:glycine hydroxymethyltransferase
MPYRVREDTGLIDFDMLKKTAALYRPKVLIAGASAYARNWDYAKMKEVPLFYIYIYISRFLT